MEFIMKHRFNITLLLTALLMASAVGAQELKAPAARMTDETIHADYKSYEAQQGRIAALNATGKHRIASYSLAKAQCWLDVSFHEYTRNDRSAFPLEALRESAKITSYLEGGGAPDGVDNPANNTPLVNAAARLREDLWTEAQAVKQMPGGHCPAQMVACGEVELVHAGNEFNQQGWRHAKPYVQIAEDNIGASRAAAERCAPAPALAVVPPVPAVAPVAAVPSPVDVSVNVLFNFDKRDMGNVRAMTKQRLDDLIERIKSGDIKPTSIALVGNADRSNHTGDRNYNMKLSVDRANTVRDYMVQHGVGQSLIATSALSDTAPVQFCNERGHSLAEFQECLLPNRRVEVHVLGVRGAAVKP
jgi:OmpA-OmpF porin, OOP family